MGDDETLGSVRKEDIEWRQDASNLRRCARTIVWECAVPILEGIDSRTRARELRGVFASSTRDYGGKICLPRCGHVKLRSRVLRLSKDGRRRATMGERLPNSLVDLVSVKAFR